MPADPCPRIRRLRFATRPPVNCGLRGSNEDRQVPVQVGVAARNRAHEPPVVNPVASRCGRPRPRRYTGQLMPARARPTRHMTQRALRRTTGWATVAVAVVLAAFAVQARDTNARQALVTAVVDGDTIRIDD